MRNELLTMKDGFYPTADFAVSCVFFIYSVSVPRALLSTVGIQEPSGSLGEENIILSGSYKVFHLLEIFLKLANAVRYR